MNKIRFCECCGKELIGKTVWLELDQRTNTYHDLGNIPADKNQGGFPFGVTCAKLKLAEHERLTRGGRRVAR